MCLGNVVLYQIPFGVKLLKPACQQVLYLAVNSKPTLPLGSSALLRRKLLLVLACSNVIHKCLLCGTLLIQNLRQGRKSATKGIRKALLQSVRCLRLVLPHRSKLLL